MGGDHGSPEVRVISLAATVTLPVPLVHGETLKVRAFDSPVEVEGAGFPLQLKPGESVSWVAVVIDEGLPSERRSWQQFQLKRKEPGQ